MSQNHDAAPPPEAVIHLRSDPHESGCSSPACMLARAKLRELVWRVEEVRALILSGDLSQLDDATLAICLDTADARALFEPATTKAVDRS